jgi:spoIIIJ-associated protein
MAPADPEAEVERADAPGSLELSAVLGDPIEAENVDVPEELLEEVRNLVASVIDAMGFESRIDVYDADSFIAVDVAPDNTALFIGQKGETIDALQYLINSAVYRKRPFVKRIILDAEGYRQRRVEAIQGIAHRTARRAIRERRTVELPPMNPSERRIVHLFLKGNPQVTTASEGSGANRRVRISPT